MTDGPAAPAPRPDDDAVPPPPPSGWGPVPVPPSGQAPRWGQYASPPLPPQQPPQGQGQYGPGQYGQYDSEVGYGYGPPPGPATWRPAAAAPGIIPLRPLSLGEIFDGAFKAIRTNPRVMFGLSAIVVSVTALIQAVITWRLFEDLEAAVVTSPAATTDESLAELNATLSDLVGQLGVAAGAQTISYVVTTILSGLLIVSVSRSVIGQTADVAEVWGSAKGQLLRLLALSVLVLVLVALPLLVWGGLMIVAISTEQWGLAALVGLLGGLAALAATATLVARTVLATPSLMLERGGIVHALRRGWRLTHGVFWRVLGIYLLTTVLVSVVAGAISGSVSIMLQFTATDPATALFSPAYLVGTTLAQILATTLTTPFTAAVIALLYIDVRMRTEGLDIELARAAEHPA